MSFKFHKRTRVSYWSDSKLVSRFVPNRPNFTLRNGYDFESFENYIDNIPKLERFVDKLQDIVMFPLDLIYSARIYFKNSKNNTHVLDGGLEKGQWYDLTYRIPHCLFSELEKFITQEKGLDIHKWEMTLTYNEDWGVKSDDERYGKLVPQALAAIEQQEIYDWWQSHKNFVDNCENFDEEETYMQKEEEMLIRLIKIRGSMWT